MIFADDLKLYFYIPISKLNDANFIEVIQEDINILFNTASSWGLTFAADKCVHLRFARSVQVPVVGSFYNLNGVPIQSRSSHKDLGITVESSLKFHQHIRNTVNKAGGISSNLLKSTVCRSADFMTALLISDIRPLTDFCSQLWGLGYLGDLRLIESVQRRWTKQVQGLHDLPYLERLRKLDLFSVKAKMERYDLISCYKIFHGLSPITPSDLFIMAPDARTRGHRFKIRVQFAATEVRKRFFTHRVVEPWNSLPSNVVDASSLPVFKTRLHRFMGDKLFHFVD